MPQSLHSLLLARKALNITDDFRVLKTTDQQLDSAKHYETTSDERSFNYYSIHEPVDEKEAELSGSSVMMYADLSESANSSLKILREPLKKDSNRFDQREIEMSDKLCAHSTPFVSSLTAGGDMISIKLENESLKSLLHQQRQAERHCQEEKKLLNLDIASLRQQINHSNQLSIAAAEELMCSRALHSDLQIKVAELENYRTTFKIDKSEHNACLQRLSSENGHLKAAQRDISALNLATEKKTAALESSNLALSEQVVYKQMLFPLCFI